MTVPSLIASADTIRLTSNWLRSMKGVESCCLWFGQRPAEGAAVVAAVVVPRQRNNQGHYFVEPSAMIDVANVARPRGWKNLAQIHSHPGDWVSHSGYDDEMANSRRALSLIYPNYGHVPGMWRYRGWIARLWPAALPAEIGVTAFLDHRWQRLDQPSANLAVTIGSVPPPKLIDLR